MSGNRLQREKQCDSAIESPYLVKSCANAQINPPEKVLILLFKYLTKRGGYDSIVNLRIISKLWKTCIDNVFKERESLTTWVRTSEPFSHPITWTLKAFSKRLKLYPNLKKITFEGSTIPSKLPLKNCAKYLTSIEFKNCHFELSNYFFYTLSQLKLTKLKLYHCNVTDDTIEILGKKLQNILSLI